MIRPKEVQSAWRAAQRAARVLARVTARAAHYKVTAACASTEARARRASEQAASWEAVAAHWRVQAPALLQEALRLRAQRQTEIDARRKVQSSRARAQALERMAASIPAVPDQKR